MPRRCGARVSPCCSSTIAGSATAAGVRPSAASTTMRAPFRSYLAGRSDVRADRLVYFGESLGTAVAVRLAVEHPPAALILRSPFTSMVDVGRLHYPILPVRWLLRDRFSSIDAIESVRSPVLIVAGDRDRIVPLEQSRRLFDERPEPRELVVVQRRRSQRRRAAGRPGADRRRAQVSRVTREGRRCDGRPLIRGGRQSSCSE